MSSTDLEAGGVPADWPWDTPPDGLRRVVYFVESAGLIKIGTSGDLCRRLRGLAAMSATPVRLMAWAEGRRSLEFHVHTVLALHRRHGEWFAPHEEVLALALAAQHCAPMEFALMVGRLHKRMEDLCLGALVAASLLSGAPLARFTEAA